MNTAYIPSAAILAALGLTTPAATTGGGCDCCDCCTCNFIATISPADGVDFMASTHPMAYTTTNTNGYAVTVSNGNQVPLLIQTVLGGNVKCILFFNEDNEDIQLMLSNVPESINPTDYHINVDGVELIWEPQGCTGNCTETTPPTCVRQYASLKNVSVAQNPTANPLEVLLNVKFIYDLHGLTITSSQWDIIYFEGYSATPLNIATTTLTEFSMYENGTGDHSEIIRHTVQLSDGTTLANDIIIGNDAHAPTNPSVGWIALVTRFIGANNLSIDLLGTDTSAMDVDLNLDASTLTITPGTPTNTVRAYANGETEEIIIQGLSQPFPLSTAYMKETCSL